MQELAEVLHMKRCFQESVEDNDLLLTTSVIPPVEKCRILGLVTAVCVLSRSIINDLRATIKNTAGGELKTYSSLIEKALDISLDRLSKKAVKLEADGVFGIQIACPEVAGGAAEVVIIGTAYRRVIDEKKH